jgi:hypothetical protein
MKGAGAGSSVVDPDPVGWTSFCRIRISTQGMPIRIDIISKQMIKLINNTLSRKFQYAVQNNENYDTFDADDNGKTLYSGNAWTKKI